MRRNSKRTKKYGHKLDIKICRQEEKVKGDTVRHKFSMAKKDILMILDFNLTFRLEDLIYFFDAGADVDVDVDVVALGVCKFANAL